MSLNSEEEWVQAQEILQSLSWCFSLSFSSSSTRGKRKWKTNRSGSGCPSKGDQIVCGRWWRLSASLESLLLPQLKTASVMVVSVRHTKPMFLQTMCSVKTLFVGRFQGDQQSSRASESPYVKLLPRKRNRAVYIQLCCWNIQLCCSRIFNELPCLGCFTATVLSSWSWYRISKL